MNLPATPATADTRPRIRVAYEVVTPESAAEGDAEERGWDDEDGHDCTPDAGDLADGLTCVDLAAAFLRKSYASEASASHFHAGMWYISNGEADWRTCATRSQSFHLVGFTADQEADICRRVLTSLACRVHMPA